MVARRSFGSLAGRDSAVSQTEVIHERASMVVLACLRRHQILVRDYTAGNRIGLGCLGWLALARRPAVAPGCWCRSPGIAVSRSGLCHHLSKCPRRELPAPPP